MTTSDVDELMDNILATMCGLRDGLIVRLDALERQLAAQSGAKAGPFGVRWAGVYRDLTSFAEGELVTHKGGLWLATADTSERPGASPDWRLIVKSKEAPDA